MLLNDSELRFPGARVVQSITRFLRLHIKKKECPIINFTTITIKMQCSKYFLLFVILVLSNHYATAAPGSVFTSSSRSDDPPSFSPLSYVASKAVGALVKCASFACQWLPIPDFIKPARPTLRIVKPSNLCVRDMDFSLEDFD